jgi:spermidine/putrescine transport system substrate-binding protein
VPDTGALLVGDHLVVPRGSPRLGDVLPLLDHYLQPDVAAAVSLTVPGLCPVAGAWEVMNGLDPRRAASPLVVPTDADLARCQVLHPLGDADERLFAEAYVRVAGP